MDKIRKIDVLGKQRIYYLDNIRAFAMICIIFGHCNELVSHHPILYSWISFWHVEIFFVISGYLLFLKSEKSNKMDIEWRKRTPYYLNLFYLSTLIKIFVEFLLQIIGACVNVQEIKEVLLKIVFLDGNSASWFLPALLIAEIILYFFVNYHQFAVWIIGGVITVFMILFLPGIYNVCVLSKVFCRSIVGFLFVLLGYNWVRIDNWLPEIKRW